MDLPDIDLQCNISELFFNIATITHQYHFIYEIVFNWLAQQSSLESSTILRLAIKYLSAPDDATEPLFWTLCIIVYRSEVEDLKEEVPVLPTQKLTKFAAKLLIFN